LNLQTQLFVLGDGDRVQSMIDSALFGGDLSRVQALSASLTLAMHELAEIVRRNNGWHLVFSGGDDICVTVEPWAYREDLIRALMCQFNERTGGSISFGVGESIETAYINLRRAKARGSGVLVRTGTID